MTHGIAPTVNIQIGRRLGSQSRKLWVEFASKWKLPIPSLVSREKSIIQVAYLHILNKRLEDLPGMHLFFQLGFGRVSTNSGG